VATLIPALKLPGRLGAVADTLYLVRLDGYLGLRSEPLTFDRLASYLQALDEGSSDCVIRTHPSSP
jgi:hypothetical protein